MKVFILLGAFFIVSSCAQNHFSQFYHDRTGGVDVTTMESVVLPDPNKKPILYTGNDPERDRIKMLEDGYIMMGFSSFNAGNVNKNDVFIQANKVRASVIVLYSDYTNTVSGTIPLTLPDTQTSTTNIYGSINSSAGYGTYSGTGTTTTHGTKPTFIPYSVRRYDYGASYWIKTKSVRIGTFVVDMDADTRAKIESNKGLLIDVVVKNSPAYKADIFRGDILKKIGSVDIYSTEDFQTALETYAHQSVTVVIYRSGKEIEKQITLNSSI
jgi:hypothetical protein